MNNNIPAVEKTLALLEVLAESENGLTQAQIRDQLALSMSTCYRILQTLLARDWVQKDEKSVYHLGKGLLPLFIGSRKESFFPGELQFLLDETAKKYEIGCKLSIRQGQEQVTVFRSQPTGSEFLPVFSSKKISRFPIIEGSVGAALLAEETKENILLLAENCTLDIQEKYCPVLITDRIDFLHKYGYAFNENNRWHICAFSIPVYESSNRIFGALTFILPRAGLDAGTQKKYIALLKETSKKCENMLHYKKGENL